MRAPWHGSKCEIATTVHATDLHSALGDNGLLVCLSNQLID